MECLNLAEAPFLSELTRDTMSRKKYYRMCTSSWRIHINAGLFMELVTFVSVCNNISHSADKGRKGREKWGGTCAGNM